MRILVCISHVPDTSMALRFTSDGSGLDASALSFVIGPYEDYALARAVELKEKGQASHISVLNVGTQETEPTLRRALAIGADEAFRIDAHPKDGYFVAKQIVHFLGTHSVDMVLMGRETTDFSGCMVHSLVGLWMDWAVVCPVMRLEVSDSKKLNMRREVEGGTEDVVAAAPIVLGCQEPIAEWRIPSIRGIMSARQKPLAVLKPVSVSVASPTTKCFSPLPARGACTMIEAHKASELWDRLRTEKKLL